MICAFCNKKISMKDKVMRQDTCPHCDRDLRCCKQCNFYDPHAYNDCREVNAERITDKERSNFCEYYIPKGVKGAPGGVNRTADAKKALEALFKKKS